MKYFSISFLWGLFKWFFSGIECGFDQFPTFGLQAWKHTYDFQQICINCFGMKSCTPHVTNLIV